MQGPEQVMYVYLVDIQSKRMQSSICTLYFYLVKLKSQRNARYLIENVCIPSIDKVLKNANAVYVTCMFI